MKVCAAWSRKLLSVCVSVAVSVAVSVCIGDARQGGGEVVLRGLVSAMKR